MNTQFWATCNGLFAGSVLVVLLTIIILLNLPAVAAVISVATIGCFFGCFATILVGMMTLDTLAGPVVV